MAEGSVTCPFCMAARAELVQLRQVHLEIFCSLMSEFQDVHDDRGFFCREHACKSQSIPSIISLAAKNRDALRQSLRRLAQNCIRDILACGREPR